MVNGRVTVEQWEWLQARADELGGNLSASLRQTITDGRLLEMARADYRRLRSECREFVIPRDDDGSSPILQVILSQNVSETDDLALRRTEDAHED